jgi:hypothetical protein
VDASDYTLNGTNLEIKASALTDGVKLFSKDVTTESWIKTTTPPKEYWSKDGNEWRLAYEAYDSSSKENKIDWYPAWAFEGNSVKEKYERSALTQN